MRNRTKLPALLMCAGAALTSGCSPETQQDGEIPTDPDEIREILAGKTDPPESIAFLTGAFVVPSSVQVVKAPTEEAETIPLDPGTSLVLTRPAVIETTQSPDGENTSSKIWLVTEIGTPSEIENREQSTAINLGFVAVNQSFVDTSSYHVSEGRKPASICEYEVRGSFTPNVEYSASRGGAYTEFDGTNVPLAQGVIIQDEIIPQYLANQGIDREVDDICIP